MPSANDKQRKHDSATEITKGFPQMRAASSPQKSREQQKNGREHGALAFSGLTPVQLKNSSTTRPNVPGPVKFGRDGRGDYLN